MATLQNNVKVAGGSKRAARRCNPCSEYPSPGLWTGCRHACISHGRNHCLPLHASYSAFEGFALSLETSYVVALLWPFNMAIPLTTKLSGLRWASNLHKLVNSFSVSDGGEQADSLVDAAFCQVGEYVSRISSCVVNFLTNYALGECLLSLHRRSYAHGCPSLNDPTGTALSIMHTSGATGTERLRAPWS